MTPETTKHALDAFDMRRHTYNPDTHFADESGNIHARPWPWGKSSAFDVVSGTDSHKPGCDREECGIPFGCAEQWSKAQISAMARGVPDGVTGDEAPPGEPVMRLDAGKARFDMIPPEALYALAELYAQGGVKYPMDGGRGWERGMPWSKCFAPMMRHAWKFWRGEEFDEETGAHHMIAVAWNAFAIFTYFTRKRGADDRHGPVLPC